MYLPHFKTNPTVDCQMMKGDAPLSAEQSFANLSPDVTGSLPDGPGARAKQFASYNLSNEATSN